LPFASATPAGRKIKLNSARAKFLAARTIDSAGIGEAPAEKAHNLPGKNTHAGTFSNRPGEFFDVEYDRPPGLLAGRSVITLKFQGWHGGSMD
jgi:hypothetical protein